MAARRPTPFDLVFATDAGAFFAPVRSAIEALRLDPRDRDGFLLLRESAELLQRLRPAEGLGAGMELLAAFVHYAYLFWKDGEQLTVISDPRLADFLAHSSLRPSTRDSVRYVQLPPRRVWATLAELAPPEPLDGWFSLPGHNALSLLAIFGLNPARAGFSAVEVSGPHSGVVRRPDGSPLFHPLLEGGASAGLASLADADELLELGWREASG